MNLPQAMATEVRSRWAAAGPADVKVGVAAAETAVELQASVLLAHCLL